jgi:hypothetical protein
MNTTYLLSVANRARAGGPPANFIWSRSREIRSLRKHTIGLLKQIWDKICFAGVVESRDRKFELVRKLKRLYDCSS